MEGRFGADFSRVRVHRDGQAADSARSLHASAYVVGQDIVFGAGRYSTTSWQGRRLLAHELAHVSQQRHARTPLTLSPGDPAGGLERSASRAGLRVAFGLPAGDVGRTAVMSVQREDENVPLGVLDYRALDAVASAALGETTWHVFRELLRGFVGGVEAGEKSGKVDRARQKFAPLLLHPIDARKDLADLALGYVWGVLQGLVSPITDLWNLIKFVFEAKEKATEWLTAQGRKLVRNPEVLLEKAAALGARLQALRRRAGEAFERFLANPRGSLEQLKKFVDTLQEGAMSAVRAAGHKAADAIFDLLDLPWSQFGEAVGKVVGAVLAQVLLLVFSEGIGNAISAVGGVVGRVASMAATEAIAIFQKLGQLALKLVEALKSSVLKLFEGLGAELGAFFEEVGGFFRALAESVEPAPAVAGGPPAPPGFFSKAVKDVGGTKVPRKTPR
jgi:hypothetical protein